MKRFARRNTPRPGEDYFCYIASTSCVPAGAALGRLGRRGGGFSPWIRHCIYELCQVVGTSIFFVRTPNQLKKSTPVRATLNLRELSSLWSAAAQLNPYDIALFADYLQDSPPTPRGRKCLIGRYNNVKPKVKVNLGNLTGNSGKLLVCPDREGQDSTYGVQVEHRLAEKVSRNPLGHSREALSQ